jgi:hypothetical protein
VWDEISGEDVGLIESISDDPKTIDRQRNFVLFANAVSKNAVSFFVQE